MNETHCKTTDGQTLEYIYSKYFIEIFKRQNERTYTIDYSAWCSILRCIEEQSESGSPQLLYEFSLYAAHTMRLYCVAVISTQTINVAML